MVCSSARVCVRYLSSLAFHGPVPFVNEHLFQCSIIHHIIFIPIYRYGFEEDVS